MGRNRWGQTTLRYAQIDDVFRQIHNAACTALLYPLKIALTEWFTPIIAASATKCQSEIEMHQANLLIVDNSVGLYPQWTAFNRNYQIGVRRPKHMWFSDDSADAASDNRMSEPVFRLDIPHPVVHGNRYATDPFGSWLNPDDAIALSRGMHGIGMADFSPDLKETFDFTVEQLDTLFSKLDPWYCQFATDGSINRVSSSTHYHRTAAAMYYAPVIASWVQRLAEKGRIKLAPVCNRLTRANNFSYEFAMCPDLASTLQSALSLAIAQEAAE